MTSRTLKDPRLAQADGWLGSYYLTRAGASVCWVAAALTVGRSLPAVGMVLLIVYPAWDAVANLADARRNGGLQRNPTQAANAAISGLATLAVAIAITLSMSAALSVIGIWASLAGLLQLATGVRRWKSHGAQWAMILSGAQSTLAGVIFIKRAFSPKIFAASDIAPYVAFGALYFLVSAVWIKFLSKTKPVSRSI